MNSSTSTSIPTITSITAVIRDARRHGLPRVQIAGQPFWVSDLPPREQARDIRAMLAAR